MRDEASLTWHALDSGAVMARLATRRDGLTPSEVAERKNTYGPNRLPEPRRTSFAWIVLRQLMNPLTYLLVAAGAISGFLQQWSDAGFIGAVILIDVSIGASQEWQAEFRAESLKKVIRISPKVIRAGLRKTVPAEDLVPGDIVVLESGESVPADLRLISTHDLLIDESLLTGESVPAPKTSTGALPAATGIGDRANMAHAGTMVVSGRGSGVVCTTGSRTQLGSIATLLKQESTRPPLLVRMDAFSKRIALATIALIGVIAAGLATRGTPPEDILLFGIALAVSAIPEGLPMAITIALSVASSRMGKRGVIVRRLPAVEALGSCTLIATDKTGTLTANRLTVKKIALPDNDQLDIEGEGLELEGAIHDGSREVSDAETLERLSRLATAAALTNEASLHSFEGVVEATGDAVDIAFLVLAEKLGISRKALLASHTPAGSIPYEPKRSYSAAANADNGHLLVTAKGAPEVILPMCALETDWAARAVNDLAAEGYRVLAVAEGDKPAPLTGALEDDLRDLKLLGLAGLVDPLRSEAPEAVSEARAAGIDVCMITGDHPTTALAIARQLDPVWSPDVALTGSDLERLEGEARDRAILDTAIFARIEPAQKLMIVKDFQKAGHLVAVTGDGVNDAPALNTADVGVAMGAAGTDVARAASDLIITDDNFASIVAGIEEGRAAYDNIRKIVWLLISTAITEVTLVLLAVAFGVPMPLSAVQILWLNLVTEGIQDVALAFEGREPDVMARGPRRPRQPIFDRQMIEQCLLMGIFMGIAAFCLFYWWTAKLGHDLEQSRNLILLLLVSFNNIHVLNCRSETRSFFSIPIRANPFIIASIAAAQAVHVGAMHIPFLQDVLGVAPVSWAEWSGALALAATSLVLGEIYKLVRARPEAARQRAQRAGASLTQRA